VVRAQFVNHGSLAGTLDTNFRAVDNNWPVFGLAHDLGTAVTTATAPVVFSVGHVRDPEIQYIVAGASPEDMRHARRSCTSSGGALQSRSGYFWSKYSTVAAMVRRISAKLDLWLTSTSSRSPTS
jgi:hypothetical protein